MSLAFKEEHFDKTVAVVGSIDIFYAQRIID